MHVKQMCINTGLQAAPWQASLEASLEATLQKDFEKLHKNLSIEFKVCEL
jgi:hypothetical protein